MLPPCCRVGIPLIRNQNIKPNKLDADDLLFINETYESSFKGKRLKAGDLLTARTGYPGTTCIVPPEFENAQSFTTLITRPTNKINSLFLSIFMNSDVGIDFFDKNQIGGGQKNINAATLKNFIVAFPDSKEQTAIANVLSDSDALIDALEQLIAKKQAIKSATMQQLLTGRTRLPAFALRPDGTPKGYKPSELGDIPEDWEVCRLGELAVIKSGGTPSTTVQLYWDGYLNWCTPTDITALCGRKYLGNTARKITELGVANSAAEIFPAGTIVMTSRATIGECAITVAPMTTNQGFKNFLCNDCSDNEFMYYLLGILKSRLIGLCSGSTFLEISTTQVKNIKVSVPKKEEQTAIATILSDMDNELQALTQKLEKARAMKQGMMQQLLTGKIRLPLAVGA